MLTCVPRLIKVNEMIEADSQSPEKDDLIYAVGTKQKSIYGNTFSSPKTEFVNQKVREIIHHIEEEKESLKNCKTRKEKLAVNEIQDVIFPKEERHIFQEVFDNNYARLISVNYLTLHNLLPITGNSHCFFVQ